ncbi:MAG TPA: BatD family protein [Syntrophales bacterium]|nr:BatD family protein [Syntrophales bacterium]
MKRITMTIVLVLSCLLASASGAAQVGVTLSLERSEATPIDTIRMEVKVSGTRSGDTAPVIHGLESFQVTQGGTSSRVEIVNGKMSSGIDYSYFIQPRKTGVFTIGPAEIEVDGNRAKSNTVTLDVKEISQEPGSNRGPVFIEASISSEEVYVEEQAMYTIKLYYRVGIDDLSLKLPEIDHIVFKQLGRPSEYQTTCGGKAYQVLEVRHSLLASQAGEYAIWSSSMRMTVRQSGGHSPFSFLSGRPLTLATDPVVLKVRDLPEKGKPTGFSGLIGDFQIESGLEPLSLKAGESATLTIRISGRGNVNRIPDIDLPEMPFARTYSDKPVMETQDDSHGIGGTKTMKWALVPEKAGRFDVPPLTVSFFNPHTGEYTVLKTPLYTLSVSPGEDQAVTVFQATPNGGKPAEGSAKQEVRQVGKDILPIHTTLTTLSVPYRFLSTGWFLWLALFGPVSVYVVLLCGLRIYKRSPEHRVQLRSRQAYRSLQKRCRRLHTDGGTLIDAFTDYLNDRFDLSIGVLTADDTARLLRGHGAGDDTVETIRRIIQTVENAVYAGKDLNGADAAGDLLERVKTLEKEIR